MGLSLNPILKPQIEKKKFNQQSFGVLGNKKSKIIICLDATLQPFSAFCSPAIQMTWAFFFQIFFFRIHTRLHTNIDVRIKVKIQVAFIDICSIHFGAHGKSDCDGIGRSPGILSECLSIIPILRE